ncbi:hypothetical protein SMD44_p20015 (plasmid) [Streptomyces alboflavus]|uniref:Uncharacterized protein n=1 Tax=Streptomyces alboflavus TaxID=67267 RepID=A0A291W452_9ACTN|nr:hypothetical protein SMD44_p20015 [Streptomyces alboflavus]
MREHPNACTQPLFRDVQPPSGLPVTHVQRFGLTFQRPEVPCLHEQPESGSQRFEV